MYVKYIIAFILLSFLSDIHGQGENDYVQYTVNDGLPSNNVYQALQDKKGYMWFATEGGVAKFDGREFKKFTVKDGLPTNDIFQMVEDEVGRIWLQGFSNSVSYIQNDKVVLFNPEDKQCLGREEFKRLSFISKSNEGIDLSYVYGGFKVNGNKVKCFNTIDEIGIRKKVMKYVGKAEDLLSIFYLEDLIVVFDNDIVFSFDNEGSFRCKLKLDKTLLQGTKIRSSDNYISKSVSLMLSADKSRIYVMPLDSLVLELTIDLNLIFGDIPSHVRYEWVDDYLQIQTNLGCFNLDWNKNKSTCEIFDIVVTSGVFDSNLVNRVFIDRMGNVWVVNNKSGIYFISKFNKTILENKNIESAPIQTLAMVEDLIVYGDDLGHVKTLESNQVDIYIKSNESVKSIKKIEYDSISGELIFLKNGQYPLFYNFDSRELNSLFDNQLKIESKSDLNKQYVVNGESRNISNHHLGIPDDFTLLENEILFALNDFIIKVKRDQYQIDTIVYLRSNLISSVEGEIVICNNNNLSFQDSSFTQLVEYKYECGIASIERIGDGVLVLLENGKLHFANLTDSILCTYSKYKPLSGVDLLIEDKVWIASNTGLYGYVYSQCNLSLDKFYIVKGINDFLIKNDSIYYATDYGLITKHLNENDSISLGSPVYFSISDQFEKFTVSENEKLDYNQNNIKFNLDLLDYSVLGDYQVHIKLISSDTVIINSSSNEFIFPNLEPNDYRLEFNVSDNFGRISKQYVFKFRINDPWWGRSLFQALILMGFVVGCLIIYTKSINRIKEKEAQETLINKKMAELRLTALQSQMNPHFIFNCLNSIQYLIQIEDSKSADDYLSQFSNLLRSFLENSMDKFVTVKKEIDLVLTYCNLEKLRFEKSYDIEYFNDLSVIENEDLVIPTNIIQPIVENAINHGLFHKRKKGVLIIKIDIQNKAVRVIIEDNGIGRSAAKEIKLKSDNNYKSLGLQILNEKLNVLRKVENYNVGLQYDDLYDELKQSQGTRVIIEFPIKKTK